MELGTGAESHLKPKDRLELQMVEVRGQDEVIKDGNTDWREIKVMGRVRAEQEQECHNTKIRASKPEAMVDVSIEPSSQSHQG